MRFRSQYQTERSNPRKSQRADSNRIRKLQPEGKQGAGATGGGILLLGLALLILSNASNPHGHPKPAATVTVQAPAPHPIATITLIKPTPEPTITVVASSGDSSVFSALGQVGGFLVGIGTMLVGLATVVKRHRKGKGTASSDHQPSQ